MSPLRTLEQELSVLDPNLVKVFRAIAKGISFIAVRVEWRCCTSLTHHHHQPQDSLRITADAASITGTTNSFGDQQLQADVRADLFLYDCLQQCGAVETASSEEQTDEKDLGGEGFTV